MLLELLPYDVCLVIVLVSMLTLYLLIFSSQSMLGSVIYARDKWLKPGGIILPSHATVSLLTENSSFMNLILYLLLMLSVFRVCF